MTRIVGDVVAHGRTAEDVAEGVHAEYDRIVPIDQRNDDIALLVLRGTGSVEPSSLIRSRRT